MLPWRLFADWDTVTTLNRLRLESFVVICSISVKIHRGDRCISELIIFRYLFSYSHNRSQTWLSFPSFFSGFIQNFLNTHCGELVSVCETYLGCILLSENGTENLNEDLMVRIFRFDFYQLFFTGIHYIVFKYVILTHILQRKWRILNKLVRNRFDN